MCVHVLSLWPYNVPTANWSRGSPSHCPVTRVHQTLSAWREGNRTWRSYKSNSMQQNVESIKCKMAPFLSLHFQAIDLRRGPNCLSYVVGWSETFWIEMKFWPATDGPGTHHGDSLLDLYGSGVTAVFADSSSSCHTGWCSVFAEVHWSSLAPHRSVNRSEETTTNGLSCPEAAPHHHRRPWARAKGDRGNRWFCWWRFIKCSSLWRWSVCPTDGIWRPRIQQGLRGCRRTIGITLLLEEHGVFIYL